jgi:ElaB/YqjD/DUF883 family membrane-anchored ribosome-binding protein
MDEHDRTRIREAGEPAISDWATSEARDLVDVARRRAVEAKHDAQDYAAEATGYLREAVEQAREYVGDAVQQAREKAEQYGARGFEKAKRDVVGYTRGQPLTALAIAATAGLLLGWLSGASGRR